MNCIRSFIQRWLILPNHFVTSAMAKITSTLSSDVLTLAAWLQHMLPFNVICGPSGVLFEKISCHNCHIYNVNDDSSIF